MIESVVLPHFAGSHHFEGNWDTEGGREAKAVTRHIQNERDVGEQVSILDAGR